MRMRSRPTWKPATDRHSTRAPHRRLTDVVARYQWRTIVIVSLHLPSLFSCNGLTTASSCLAAGHHRRLAGWSSCGQAVSGRLASHRVGYSAPLVPKRATAESDESRRQTGSAGCHSASSRTAVQRMAQMVAMRSIRPSLVIVAQLIHSERANRTVRPRRASLTSLLEPKLGPQPRRLLGLHLKLQRQHQPHHPAARGQRKDG